MHFENQLCNFRILRKSIPHFYSWCEIIRCLWIIMKNSREKTPYQSWKWRPFISWLFPARLDLNDLNIVLDLMSSISLINCRLPKQQKKVWKKLYWYPWFWEPWLNAHQKCILFYSMDTSMAIPRSGGSHHAIKSFG